MQVNRLPLQLAADPRRVIARPFFPGGAGRTRAIMGRVAEMPDADVASLLASLLADYQERHRDIRGTFRANYRKALAATGTSADANEDRRLLLGAYFTHEYSLESVALFNPSMVAHPDQSGVADGAVRFVMSLRACGEGHISSIELRTGIVSSDASIALDPPRSFAHTESPIDDALYDKTTYVSKLQEMKGLRPETVPILDQLGPQFTVRDLSSAIERCRVTSGGTHFREAVDVLLWLAHSNYELEFAAETDISERVIFPVSENESRGIEDARFVRFVHPDGKVAYFATYTAYNGFRVLPQLIETTDFRHFKVITLNGSCVQNKGMALFPRKVNGQFLMASRLDGENIFVLASDNIHFWNESRLVYSPRHPWELVQVGNCGSPIETEEGWILLTHGVGPMRQYWLGALLLDLDDPSKVIGDLTDPLMTPNSSERDGYVPNVVYSCGALRHGDCLVLPYAVSDSHSSIATLSISELLAAFRRR